MKGIKLWGTRGFIFTSGCMLVFIVLVVLGRLSFQRNPEADTLLSNIASIVSSTLATGYFLLAWSATSKQDKVKPVWGLFATGLGLWALAETIWAYYELVAGIEVPYPSWADLFWLIGYWPIGLAIRTEYRRFQSAGGVRQRIVLNLVILLFALIIARVVIWPILASFDPERILESIINLAYPVLDLSLLALTVSIIIALQQGRFGFTWKLIGMGLIATAMADLLFSYASWNEIYDPAGQLNAITLFTDTLFVFSYLAMGLGAYSYRLISEKIITADIQLMKQPSTKTNILLFVDKEGKIITLSDNFLNLTGENVREWYLKMPLDQALQTNRDAIAQILAKTSQQGSTSSEPIKVKDIHGTIKDAWLTAYAVRDNNGNFISTAVILKTILSPRDGPERPMTEEQHNLLENFLNKTGDYQSEENQTIKRYFLDQLQLLYSLIQQFSGALIADRLFEHLSGISDAKRWQFTFGKLQIGIPEEYEGVTLADRLSTLLNAARDYAGEATNLKMIEQEMRLLDRNLSPESLKHIDKHNLRSVAMTAA